VKFCRDCFISTKQSKVRIEWIARPFNPFSFPEVVAASLLTGLLLYGAQSAHLKYASFTLRSSAPKLAQAQLQGPILTFRFICIGVIIGVSDEVTSPITELRRCDDSRR